MRLQVEYDATVVAVVDTAAGTVEEVHVCDELGRPIGVATADAIREVPEGSTRYRRAVAVAEDPSIIWPSWEFGW